MYKLPASRKKRRFLRDYKKTLEDAQTLGTTVVKEACRAVKEQCQTLRSVGLEQRGSTQTARYQYRPLDRSRQEIRLLILEPGSGTSMLRCTLEHAFLDVTPPPLYETISYVCGNPTRKRSIILHGHKIRAMATSEAALRRMRLRDKPRTLWIDSICINQENADEKGHQVGMMCQTCTKTFRNLIWLGPYDATFVTSINAMEAILQEIATETRNYADFQELVVEQVNHSDQFSKTTLSNTVNCLAFLPLLDNPWFSRLWIVQEASLAPSSVCHYGEFEMPLISILRSAKWLGYKYYQLPKLPRSALMCLHNAISMFDLADSEFSFSLRVPFLHLWPTC
jgi:hypothetical protein